MAKSKQWPILIKIDGDSTGLNSSLNDAGTGLDKFGKAATTTASKVSGDLDKATKKAANNIEGFSESAGDADSVMMGLAGAIDLVNPRMGDLVRVSGTLLAGTEAVTRAIKFANPIFIGLALVAAVLGAAYFFLSEDTAAAEEAAEKLKEEQEALNDVMLNSSRNVDSYQRELDVMNGVITESNAAFQDAQLAIQDRLAPALTEAEEQLKAARQAVDDLNDSWTVSDSIKGHVKRLKELNVTVGIYSSKVAQLTSQQGKEVTAASEVIEKRRQIKEASDKATAALKKEAAAARARSRAAAKASRDEAQAKKEASDAAKEASRLQEDYIAWTEARQLANEDMNKAQAKGWKEATQAWSDMQQERKDEAQDLADTEREIMEERLNFAGDFINASADLAEGLSKRLGATAKEQAMIAYVIGKATALTDIAINTLVAASKVTAQTGIFAAVAIPAVVALGAVQAAAVLAEPPPKFHMGGMAPDETLITAQAGEAVLSRTGVQALGGEEGVMNANRGNTTSQVVVVNQYKHRIFDSFIIDNLRRTGSPLASAIGASGNKQGILR